MSPGAHIPSYGLLMSLRCPLRQGILCFSHVLLLAFSALDKIDAGGCSSYMEGMASGGTNKCVQMSWQVWHCWLPWAATVVWFAVGRFELGADQKVVKVLCRSQWGALEWPVGGDGRHAV